VAVNVTGVNPRGDAEPLGGAEISKHLLAASVAILSARVDLVVPKFLEGIKHFVRSRSIMNSGSVSVVAEGHGTAMMLVTCDLGILNLLVIHNFSMTKT
jgi:hypothetical protein